MEIKTARRGPQGKESSVFDRLGAGRGGHLNNSSNKICKFWLSGRCLKNPCRFAHSETPDVATIHRPRQTPYYPHSSNALVSNTWRRAPRISQNVQEKVVNHKSSENVPGKSESDLEDINKKLPESVSESSSECSVVENDSNLENVVEEKPLEHVPKKTTEMVCEFWVQGTCVYGDQCPYLHSWFRGDKFKRLAELQGHNKAVNGIALPLRCNKLCSGSSDGTIRLWDCHTGQCANVINLGSKVGSVCSEGPWLFVGLPNVVKVWNTESGAEYSLNGPVGQVNALESVNDLLFAGVEDGVILAWKGTCESNLTFQLAATLKGHTHGITSLVVGGGNRLYSGSNDHTIRIKTARRGPQGKESSVFDRLGAGRGGHLNNSSNKICKFWLSGRCLKNPCRFAHSETPDVATIHRPRQTPYYPHSSNALVSNTWRRAPRISQNVQEKVVNHKSSENVPGKSESDLEDINKKLPESVSESSSECSVVENDSNLENVVEEKPLEHVPKKTTEMVCEFWVQGTCVYGDQCPYLHSWFRGDKFKRLAELQGHNKAVNGIALPLRCNKLCSGSSDGTIRLWDCHTGQCANVINLGSEVGSVCSEGLWLFVGLPNVVKVWNTESGAEYSLNGPVGQVNALESVNDLLFAGVEDGVILAWKGTCESNLTFQLAASLKGHTHGITCLVVGGGNRLYSGSKDHTIRVWDHENWQCIMTLNGHDDVVKSLMCWDKYLLSGSLDCTIKVWASTEDGSLEVIYTHSEEQGILALSGMTDPDVKPILCCSCSDKSVHLYELPTFTDRGRLFAKQEVQTLQIGPGGLFFTGDQTGLLTVYTWLAD